MKYTGGVRNNKMIVSYIGKRLRKLVLLMIILFESLFGIISVYKVVTYLTRLETRTKESNMLASEWVLKPRRVMKVNFYTRPGNYNQCSVVSS